MHHVIVAVEVATRFLLLFQHTQLGPCSIGLKNCLVVDYHGFGGRRMGLRLHIGQLHRDGYGPVSAHLVVARGDETGLEWNIIT